MVSLLRILLGTVVGVVLGGAVNVGIILAAPASSRRLRAST
jgi:gas vesicle protein